MNNDAEIALAAFRDGSEAWVRLTREVLADLGEDQHLLTDAIEEFRSLDNPAGHAATEWLWHKALDYDGTTLTYVMLSGRRIEGYYASASSNVLLSQRDHKRLRGEDKLPLHIPPRQPATFIAWIAKQDGAETRGIKLLEHAFSTAVQVSELQGNVALVLDPYDHATEAMWLGMEVGFRRSARDRSAEGPPPRDDDNGDEPKPRRLWMPLREADLGFV